MRQHGRELLRRINKLDNQEIALEALGFFLQSVEINNPIIPCMLDGESYTSLLSREYPHTNFTNFDDDDLEVEIDDLYRRMLRIRDRCSRDSQNKRNQDE